MNEDYAPRVHVPLASDTFVEHPPDMPELVHLNDPAAYVLIDFTNTRPMTISPDVSIDVAMNKMKVLGSRLLLVTDNDGSVVGVVTANDIMGDAPLRVAESDGMKHSDVKVEMIMTHNKDIKAIEWSQVKNSKVGHIVATMHHLECCYLPVVEDGKVRGLICGSEISRHLGHDISETTMCAHSLAEIVHTFD
jgi:signal-transduction protein with cAMP-binding, CBS, and nucleotidyltransferase domain